MLNMTEMCDGFVLCWTDLDKTVFMTLSELCNNEVLNEMGFSDKWKMTLIDSTCSWNSRCHGPLFCKVVSEVKKKKTALYHTSVWFVLSDWDVRRLLWGSMGSWQVERMWNWLPWGQRMKMKTWLYLTWLQSSLGLDSCSTSSLLVTNKFTCRSTEGNMQYGI